MSSHIIYTHKAHIHTHQKAVAVHHTQPTAATLPSEYISRFCWYRTRLCTTLIFTQVNDVNDRIECYPLIPCSQSTRCSLISERLCVKRIIGLWISVTFSIRKQKHLSWRFFRREQTIDPLKTFATTFGRTLNLEKRKSENGVISEF